MLDAKWTGTDRDRSEMRTLKLQQVVRRNFGKYAMFGLASNLLATWESIAITLGVSLANGGTAGLFWNYVVGAIGLSFVYASIAELGSMIPTSGGQYYWVAVLAPRPARRYLSYITGWLCAVAWQTAISASGYFIGTLIQALWILNNPLYVPHNWHASLIGLGYLIIAVTFNSLLARHLPMIEGIFVVCHIIGIAIMIPLWVMSPLEEGGSPLVDFYNPNGWASNGVATLVGSVGPISTLIGFDCSVHMAEEAKDSSRTVPLTLILGYATNALLGFFAVITCIYTIGPLDQALQASTGFPIVNMFYNATQNLAASSFMTCVLLLVVAASGIASLAAASRQLWAFARSGGVPFSHFFAPSHLPYDIPLNSVLFSLVIPIIILLLNIGSSEALSILLSIFISALMASYIITISCILIHRLRGSRLPPNRFSLGKYGVWVNIFALIYLAPVFIFSFFPVSPNPTPISMNWACAMVGGVALLATVYYVIWGRKTYTPPNEVVEDYIKRNEDQDMPTSAGKEVGGGVAEESGLKEKYGTVIQSLHSTAEYPASGTLIDKQ